MPPRFNDDRDWFYERRFGLFLHWGIYALTGEHEQAQWRMGMDAAEYTKLAQRFNPAAFDPDAWLDTAEAVGMDFVCFTTKHHDGFCMWDSASQPFNVTNTPYGRDTLAMLAEACQRRDMPLCLYYSAVDWYHPNYPNQNRSHELAQPKPGDQPDLPRYLDYVKQQVRELCTNYGPIHGFWWDMNPTDHVDKSINHLVRQLQPAAVINNRGFDEGDFGCPEREWDDKVQGLRVFDQPTQACNALSHESWAYREDDDVYADRHLIEHLDKTLARGGSYLLNTGPLPDGTLRSSDVAILKRLGDWYRRVEPALRSQPCSHLTDNPEVLLTRDGNTIYVHLAPTPRVNRVYLSPFKQLPRRATLMNTGAELPVSIGWTPTRWYLSPNVLRISQIPINALANQVPVIRLEFDHDIPNAWADSDWPTAHVVTRSQFGE